MGGEKKFVYQSNITRNTDSESNNLLERDGLLRVGNFPYYGGDPRNSNFVIGRATDITYTDNDSGSNLFSYVKSEYNTSEENCFYLRSNGIPNYEPSVGNTVIKGSWNNENSYLNLSNRNYYSIYYENRGWFDSSNYLQGTMYKIPLEPKLATQNIYTSAATFQENFWFSDDLYWKSLMQDTKYNSKLLTPMGAIGVAVNGINIYNFAI